MNFLRGAMILTLAGTAVKIIGSINRILLSRLLGGEGIGLYQMAYPVYLLFTAIASAGIPIAVSILVGEKIAIGAKGELCSLRKILLKTLLVAGVCLALLVAGSAGWLVETGFISDERAYYGILAVTPAIFLSLLLGGMRGYFQGFQMMTPTAVSQITEQFFRVTFMLAAAYLLLPYGLEYAAAGAAGGAGVGAVFGIIVLLLFYKKVDDENYGKNILIKQSDLIKRFLTLAVPISLSNLTIPLTAVLDMFLVPHCLLKAGYSGVETTTMFGYLAGMAQPLVLLAIIPVTAIVFSMVPTLANLRGKSDVAGALHTVNSALKWVLVITVPAGIGMSALGGQLSELLYAAPMATDAMVHTGPAIFLLGLLQISSAVLQGAGKVNIPLYNLAAGMVVKIVFVMFYANNIVECAWGTNLHYAVTVILNLGVLFFYGYRFQLWLWLRIICSASIMGIGLLFIHGFLAEIFGYNVATVASLLTATMLYGLLLLLFRVVTLKEIKDIRLNK